MLNRIVDCYSLSGARILRLTNFLSHLEHHHPDVISVLFIFAGFVLRGSSPFLVTLCILLV